MASSNATNKGKDEKDEKDERDQKDQNDQEEQTELEKLKGVGSMLIKSFGNGMSFWFLLMMNVYIYLHLIVV